MSWTAPKTWATGEMMTADLMNQQVRDNLTFLNGLSESAKFYSTTNTFSTTSTTYVDITGASLSYTPKLNRALLFMSCNGWFSSNTGSSLDIAYQINSGTDVTKVTPYQQSILTFSTPIAFFEVITVTPNTQITIKLRLRQTGASTGVNVNNVVFGVMDFANI